MNRAAGHGLTGWRAGGFTLMEMLVAITILALFMTVAMGSIRTASKSLAASVDRADQTEEMRTVADFLRRQFAGLPPLVVGEGTNGRIAFAADEKSMRFVAPAPRFSAGAGLMIYRLAVEPVDGREYLVLSHAPFDPGKDDFEVPDDAPRRIISRGFETVSFRYFGAEAEREPADWRFAWRDDAEWYPVAVAIRTTTEPGSKGWPELLYTLRSGDRS